VEVEVEATEDGGGKEFEGGGDFYYLLL